MQTLKKEISRKDPAYAITCRLLLGAIFLLAGFDNFFNFLPFDIMPTSAETYFAGGTGSMALLSTLKITEILIGLMFIFNFFAPLALIILMPILVNIGIYSVFYNMENLAMVALLAVLAGSLFYFYRKLFVAFMKPQLYTNGMAESSSEILILEEVEEKMPKKSGFVKQLILEMKNS